MKKKSAYIKVLFSLSLVVALGFGLGLQSSDDDVYADYFCTQNVDCIADGYCSEPKKNHDGTPVGCTKLIVGCIGNCSDCTGADASLYCKYTGVLTDSCTAGSPTDGPVNCGTITEVECELGTSQCECTGTRVQTNTPCEIQRCSNP